jgi:phosphohistidine phosphatase
MKKLLLVRHAKAVHDNSYSDFERPLKHKGIEDATLMAERLKSHSIVPQILVTSPSIRTEATANILSQHLSLPQSLQNEEIYEAGQQTLINIINEFDDKYDFMGLVGHNPGIGQMLYHFTGDMRDVSPGTVALIEFGFEKWELLSGRTGTLTWFSSPKDH